MPLDIASACAATRKPIADGYLRDRHCDPTVAGCPTATLVTDVARASRSHPIHAACVDGVRAQVDTLAGLARSGDPVRDRAEACVQLATMMGALLLARATHGDPLSDEIVKAARAHLKKRGRR